MAERAGADAIGLVFAPGSRRLVTAEQARRVVAAVGPLVTIVGVFRDAPLEQVLELTRALRLPVVQLHGAEDDAYAAAVRPYARVIRALRWRPGLTPADLPEGADGWLLDGPDPGSGVPFDWSRAATLRGTPGLILAGGLTPANVTSGIAALAPYGVDVSSGVEAGPGVKDPVLVRAFLQAARAGTAEPAAGP